MSLLGESVLLVAAFFALTVALYVSGALCARLWSSARGWMRLRRMQRRRLHRQRIAEIGR